MMHMQYRQETSAMNNETFICDAETIKQSMHLKAHQDCWAIIWIVQQVFFWPRMPQLVRNDPECIVHFVRCAHCVKHHSAHCALHKVLCSTSIHLQLVSFWAPIMIEASYYWWLWKQTNKQTPESQEVSLFQKSLFPFFILDLKRE